CRLQDRSNLTTGSFTWKIDTRVYHARPATYLSYPPGRVAAHSSIPDGSNQPRSFRAPYDDTTSSRSSTGDPESATSDQRCFQTGSPAWFRASAHGGNVAADVAYRYCTQGNYRWQVDLRGAPRVVRRRRRTGRDRIPQKGLVCLGFLFGGQVSVPPS